MMLVFLVALLDTTNAYDRAKVFISQGKYEQAIRELEKYLEAVKDRKAYELLIRTYMTIDEPEKALSTIDEALKVFEGDFRFLHFKAMILDNLDRLEEAVSIYEELYEKYPDSLGIKLNYGIALFRLGKYSSSLRILKELEEHSEQLSDHQRYRLFLTLSYIYKVKDDEDASVEYALKAYEFANYDRKNFFMYLLKLLEENGRNDELLRISKELVSIHPDDPDYHFYYAKALYKTGDSENYIQALSEFAITLELGGNEDAYRYMAIIYEELGKRRKAIDIANRCLWKKLVCRLVKIYLLAKEKRLEEALEIALMSNIKNSVYYSYLGFIFWNQDELELAQKYFKIALNMEPENPERYKPLLSIYASLNKHEEYYALLSKYVQLDHEDAEAYFRYAEYLVEKGKLDSAFIMYEKAANVMENRIKKEDSPPSSYYEFLSIIYNNWGYILVDRDIDVEKGFQLLTKAVQLNPTDPNILDSMGWALYKKGEILEAWKYIRKAYELAPDEEEIRKHYEILKEEVEDVQESIDS